MTIEEQIMKLQTYKMYEGEDTVYVERDDVLKALEQQPKMQDCEHCIHTYGTLGCCDMVNNEWVYDCEFGKEQYKKEHESQPCEDCKVKKEAYIQGYDYGVKDWFKSKSQPCEDAISREAVIRLVEQYPNIIGNRCSGLIADIKHLPSVTPQQEKGEWAVIREEHEFMGGIVNEPRGCKCSNCNKVVRFKSDFCPNCGADMRESEG